MIILGIETSCDETAAAVVEDGTKILSSVVASSANMHAKTGGIIPEQAARQQVRSIMSVVQKTIIEAGQNTKFESLTPKWFDYTHHPELAEGQIPNPKSENAKGKQFNNIAIQKFIKTNIDAIAVTVGPGLIGSLLVGVETARTLSYLWKKPVVPVNHMVGHIYSNWLNSEPWTLNGGRKNTTNDRSPALLADRPKSTLQSPIFPTLVLVVSGGHTDLVLMSGHGKLKWIGGTRDDAAGEAFDKTARLLGLGYPGGPAISKQAEKYLITHNPPFTLFPRPMINRENFDFSFSGLKTSVFNKVKEQKGKEVKKALGIPELATEIQEAIVDVLVAKTMKAVDKYKPKSLLLAGGVAANKRLKEKFLKALQTMNENLQFHVPPIVLCTDNAAFIASAAFFNYKPISWRKVEANPQLEIAEKRRDAHT